MSRKKHGLMGEVNLLGLNSLGQNPGMSPITGALIGGGVANLSSMAIGNLPMFQSMAAPGGMPVSQDRHFWGFLTGLVASGVLWLTGPDRARHAAWGAAAGAFLAEGLPWLEKIFMGTIEVPAPVAAAGMAVATAATQSAASGGAAVTAPAAPGVAVTVATAPGATPAGTAGALGIARVHALNGLGMRRQAGGQMLNGGLGIPRVAALNGQGGLGLATVAPQPQSVGTIPGVAGPAFAGAQLGSSRPPVQLLGNATSQSRQVQLLGGPQIHGLSSAYGATLLGGGRG
jgi:hypothetical protein